MDLILHIRQKFALVVDIDDRIRVRNIVLTAPVRHTTQDLLAVLFYSIRLFGFFFAYAFAGVCVSLLLDVLLP